MRDKPQSFLADFIRATAITEEKLRASAVDVGRIFALPPLSMSVGVSDFLPDRMIADGLRKGGNVWQGSVRLDRRIVADGLNRA